MTTLRYRPRLRQHLWFVYAFPVYQLVWPPDPAAEPPSPWLWVGLLALMVATFPRERQMGVELRPDALVVRRWRTRVVPWSDVLAVSTTRSLGTDYVAIRTPRASEQRLPAPYHLRFLAPDPEFGAKADAIRAYWADRRLALEL